MSEDNVCICIPSQTIGLCMVFFFSVIGHNDGCMFPYCWAQYYLYVFVLLG